MFCVETLYMYFHKSLIAIDEPSIIINTGRVILPVISILQLIIYVIYKNGNYKE